ncbi:MAG TPA: zinc-ribbon domain containing protein [Prosthecobacter sp.]
MKDKREKLAKQRLRQVLDDRKRRIQLLLDSRWIRDAKQIPADAIPVDIERSTLINQTVPVLFYQDIEFVCCDCGRSDMWSAGSQQHYFEVKKGDPYNRPKRCYDCRQKELERKAQARERSQPKK